MALTSATADRLGSILGKKGYFFGTGIQKLSVCQSAPYHEDVQGSKTPRLSFASFFSGHGPSQMSLFLFCNFETLILYKIGSISGRCPNEFHF